MQSYLIAGQLFKGKTMDNNNEKYDYENEESYIEFIKGRVYFKTRSYQIDSWGDGKLAEKEVEKMYLAMKSYFENKKKELN